MTEAGSGRVSNREFCLKVSAALNDGLELLAAERPADPLLWLGRYMCSRSPGTVDCVVLKSGEKLKCEFSDSAVAGEGSASAVAAEGSATALGASAEADAAATGKAAEEAAAKEAARLKAEQDAEVRAGTQAHTPGCSIPAPAPPMDQQEAKKAEIWVCGTCDASNKPQV